MLECGAARVHLAARLARRGGSAAASSGRAGTARARCTPLGQLQRCIKSTAYPLHGIALHCSALVRCNAPRHGCTALVNFCDKTTYGQRSTRSAASSCARGTLSLRTNSRARESSNACTAYGRRRCARANCPRRDGAYSRLSYRHNTLSRSAKHSCCNALRVDDRK